MTFKFEIDVERPCRELAVTVGFKLGMSGEMLACIKRHAISPGPLQSGQSIKGSMRVHTEQLPAALYDLYVWLGPIKEIALNEYYDIADALLPPIQILEEHSTEENKHTLIDSEIEISTT